MSQNRTYIILLVLATLISGLSGLLGSIASGALPSAWGPYVWLAWPLFAILLLASVGLLIWQLRIEGKTALLSQAEQPLAQPSLPSRPSEPAVDVPTHREDWGEAVDVELFYGREEELATLERWILGDRCRLVALLGMGGIGKTALVTKLARQVKDEFDCVLWRSLRNAPPLEELLAECIKFLAGQQVMDLPEDANSRISLLIGHLQKQRCLLTLDNVETILREGDRAGHYREGYEAYGDLMRRVGETSHQSCLLLTSREKPKELALSVGEMSPIRSIELAGVGHIEVRQLLQDKGLFGTDEAWGALGDHYSGNPLALKLVSETIRELFGGDITRFVGQGATVFGGIRDVLEQQFGRLSALEKEAVFWLTIEREPISMHSLQENIPRPVPTGELMEAVRSLRRRSLVEQSVEGFTLQNVVMEYVTDYLVDQVCQEITTETISTFNSHALIKARAKDYIRESQVRLILKPVADRLLAQLGQPGVETRLRNLLSTLRSGYPRSPGYAAGNILNLLVQLGTELGGYDFSKLAVRQAYLQRVELHDVSFCQSDLAGCVFTETFAPITSVAFGPDGKLMAAGTNSGEIRVWRVADGSRLFVCGGHKNWVLSVAFSPDGRTLASGSNDRTLKLWDATTGQGLKTLQGHTDTVRSVAFSSDGQLVASGSDDCTVRLWDISTGQCLNILRGHADQVRSIAFSPDGLTLASGSRDRTVRLWNVSDGQNVSVLQGHGDQVSSVAFSPDARMLVSGGSDRTLRLWDISSRECLNIIEGHTKSVESAAFSPDGNTLVSSGHDETVRLWDVSSGHCLKILQGHTKLIRSVAFSPDGRILASGSFDRTVRLWDVGSGRCLNTLQGYTNRVRSITFRPDGRVLASGSEDRAVRLWDLGSMRCTNALQEHYDWARCVTFSPDGRILASSSYDRTIRLWDARHGQCLKTLRGHIYHVRSVTFNPDSSILASGGEDRTVRLWDISSGQCLKVLQGHTSVVRSVAFSPDGRTLASGSFDRAVRLWDPSSGECLSILHGHTHSVESVAFSPDGGMLATGSEDRGVRLWDIGTGQCLQTLQGHTQPVEAVAFSPDGNILASGGEDRTVRLWEVVSGHCIDILEGHTHSVECVTFSPDGRTLASASDDETIKLWDIQLGKCLRTLRADRPYERMNISGATGLTESQKATLKALGATETPPGESSAVRRSRKKTVEPASTAFNNGYAIVVGIGADLPVTLDDATAVADLLRDASRCAYPPSQVRLLAGERARRDAILSALDWLSEVAGPGATAVVYFSGHGLETPDYYLLPYGYELTDLPGTAIPGALFTDKLRAIQAGKLVVLLDCCHAGGQAEAKGWPGIKSPLPPTIAAELARSSGRVVIASSRKDEVSWTGQPYSVFTTALLEALAGYGAFEQDGYARVLDLALWVGRKVPERTQDQQHPIVKVSHLEDNFALAWYAAGDKRPRPFDWTADVPSITPGLDPAQVTAWQRMLANYRENLLLIQERMSEYVEFTAIPLQLIKEKRHTEEKIADLERKLGLRS
jgi:WD40 repeat protein